MDVWAAMARTPEQAMLAGRDFLLARQAQDGMWSDFVLAPGPSDEWVTGYVGDRLAEVPGAHDAVTRGWAALRARSEVRRGPGWGYNAHVPQDADSTAWALRLASRLGVDDVAVAQARTSMADFRHESGMLSTYGPTAAIAAFIGTSSDRGLAGWTAPHACVTAAAAGLPGLVPPQVLLDAQRPDGRWRSYWWASDTFATALAVEALIASGDAGQPAKPGGLSGLERARAWAVDAASIPGLPSLTAFELANLMIVALSASEGGEGTELVRQAAKSLAFAMLPDGSWSAGAVLRVPDPTATDPEEVADWVPGGLIEGAIVEDRRRIFTTATVVHALQVYDVVRREGARP